MHTYVKTLQEISNRHTPSRMLSFDMVHIFKALQLMEERGHVSRGFLGHELNLGEGSIKTLMKHLKLKGLIETTNGGTKMSSEGKRFFSQILSSMPRECKISKSSVALGKYNFAILLKYFSHGVKFGIEQRDAAIKMGALGATTLLYQNSKFVMPVTAFDSLKNEPVVDKVLNEKLKPEEGDVLIIGSDDTDEKNAELAAKSAALITIMNHEEHSSSISKKG